MLRIVFKKTYIFLMICSFLLILLLVSCSSKDDSLESLTRADVSSRNQHAESSLFDEAINLREIFEKCEETESSDDSTPYQIAVENGYEKSMEDWVEEIVEFASSGSSDYLKDVVESVATDDSGNVTVKYSDGREYRVPDAVIEKIVPITGTEGTTQPAPDETSGIPDESNTEPEPVISIPDGPAFIVESVTAGQGDKNVAVKVSVKDSPGITSILLDVVYNSDDLTLTDIKYNSERINGHTIQYNPDASSTVLEWINGMDDIEGDFDFATLYFDVSDTAQSSYICISYDPENVFNFEETNVHFEIANGIFNIK